MKKVLSMVLALCMLASLLIVPALAAGSKEELVEVIEVENAVIVDSVAPEVTVEELTEAVAALTPKEAAAFTELGLDITKLVQTVVSQKDVTVATGKTAQLTIQMPGVDVQYMCVWLKLPDGTMKLLKVGKPPLTFEMTESGTMVVTVLKQI